MVAPAPIPTTLAVTPTSAVLASLGQTVQLTATVLDQTGTLMTGLAVNWASSDGGVVTVDTSGLITAVENGAANITATVRGGGASGSAAITVTQRIAEVRLTPESRILRAIGETLQMSAAAVDANGHPVAGASVAWASSDEAVVTVGGDGLVTATGNGDAQVTASTDAASATADFSVRQEPTSLTVSPDSARLQPQDTLRLTAEALDANASPVVNADFTWLSDEESVATVDATGLVTGVAPGSAEVSAELAGTDLIAIASITVEQRDRVSLIALYNATDGPNWTSSENWLTEQPLHTWEGVETDAEGRVTELTLPDNQLTGYLPDELAYLVQLRTLDLWHNTLTGTLPAYLGELDNLENLNLASNLFSGPIPTELSSLTKLRSLQLTANRLTASIPPELGQLVNLESLGLRANGLTGSIPVELANLSRLRVLNLEQNALTGTIPPELGGVSSLADLALSRNRLTGTIPEELGNLSGLKELRLHENQLSGAIPTSLSKLTNVWLMSLCCNQLTGEIPRELGELSSVTFLGVHHNQLSGAVPSELGGLYRLQKLYLSDNEQLTGSLPQRFVNLRLQVFYWISTGLCSPANDRFQEWLGGIERQDGEGVCSNSAP